MDSPYVLRTDIAAVTAAYVENIRRDTPYGLFWPEQHAAICKAAERVTRQQRRHAERQAAKRR